MSHLLRIECISQIATIATTEQVEGEKQEAGLRIILERPFKEAAMACMNDPAYSPHLKARTEGYL